MSVDRRVILTATVFFALTVLVLLCLPVQAGPAAQAVEAPEPQRIVYKTTEDAKGKPVDLHLFVFKPEGWKASDTRPVIVCFFGGGWVSGTPAQFYPHCRDLAAKGMVAISAEYRVESKHGTAPQACVEDGKSAIRYVREHAKELGINPDKIIAAGGSAGGHVAASTGILKGYEAKGEDQAISSVPNLMVLFNPVIDTSAQTGYGAKKVGDEPLTLSPLHQAHQDAPASLILHGDADTTVNIDSVRRYVKRCEELGVESRLVAYEGATHGFFNHSDFRKPKQGTPDYYAMTMGEVVAFLKKHAYLEAGDE